MSKTSAMHLSLLTLIIRPFILILLIIIWVQEILFISHVERSNIEVHFTWIDDH